VTRDITARGLAFILADEGEELLLGGEALGGLLLHFLLPRVRGRKKVAAAFITIPS
jgi:hypothetical protein